MQSNLLFISHKLSQNVNPEIAEKYLSKCFKLLYTITIDTKPRNFYTEFEQF